MTLNLTKGNLLMSFISKNCNHNTTFFMSNLPPQKGFMAKYVMTCCNNIQVDFKYLIRSIAANWQSAKTIFYLEGSKKNLFSFGAVFKAPHFHVYHSIKKRTHCYTHRNKKIPSIYNLPAF